MKAVILAAGEGVRMHPLTYTRPKVMLPIANKPLLEHMLLVLKDAGINEFIFVVGYRNETIRRYFGDGQRWGVSLEYVTQKRQMGTAHALGMVKGMVGEKFILANGDIIVNAADVHRLLVRNDNTMGVVEVEKGKDLGMVAIEGGRVTHIYEKIDYPSLGFANAGLYLLTSRIFEAISHTQKSVRGEYEITDSLQWLIDEGEKLTYEKQEGWIDLSYPWDMLKANELLLANYPRVTHVEAGGRVSEKATLEAPVIINRGTVIYAGAYIIGPTIIGEDCTIGPNCFIRPNTCIGRQCHIGSAVEIKNSIIMDGTHIPHHNYVGDSIIGEKCNLGAGTKIANLRLDKQDVVVGGKETGRHKLGAIIGDNVQIGINASINVGTLIGNDSLIGPGRVVSGVILPNARLL